MLSPHAVRAAEVFVEQADDRAERMHHQPPADEARRVRQAVWETGRWPRASSSRGVPMPLAARIVTSACLKMLDAAAIDVRRAGHQAAAVHFQPPHARAGDELHAQREILRPVRAIDRALGPFDAAPHAGRPLRARAAAPR